jgi:DNA-binding MarR family transcriptional regulator
LLGLGDKPVLTKVIRWKSEFNHQDNQLFVERLCMHAWLNLRHFIDLTTSETDFGQLDSISQRVLEWVCARYNSKSNLFVQSIVLDSRIASPATIHKCLATLERTGFLSFKVDPEDARRRIVSPTAKASKTLDALSRRVEKWARQQRA